MAAERIEYRGERNVESLHAFCKDLSQDCYVVYWCGFAATFVYVYNKIPAGKHSPSDYPHGYFHNGELHQWSAKRKITAQNAGMTRD